MKRLVGILYNGKKYIFPCSEISVFADINFCLRCDYFKGIKKKRNLIILSCNSKKNTDLSSYLEIFDENTDMLRIKINKDN